MSKSLDKFLMGLTKEIRALDDDQLARAVKLCGKWFGAERDELRGALSGKRSAQVSFIMNSDPVLSDDGLAGFAESLRKRGILEAANDDEPAEPAKKAAAKGGKKGRAAHTGRAKGKAAAKPATGGRKLSIMLHGRHDKIVEALQINRAVDPEKKTVVVKRAAFTATAVPGEGVSFSFGAAGVPRVVKFLRRRLDGDKLLGRVRIESPKDLDETLVERLELRHTSKGYAI